MSDYQLTPRPDQAPSEWTGSRGLGRPNEPGWAVEEEEGSFDWREYASAILRHKWMVMVGVLLGTGAAWLSWTHIQTGQWRATGSLWLQPAASETGPIVTEGILQTTSWLDLIRSNAVLDTVVMAQKLYITPAVGEAPLFENFQISDQLQQGQYVLGVLPDGSEVRLVLNGEVVERGAPGNTFGTGHGFAWTPPAEALTRGREIAFMLAPPRSATALLQSQLVPGLNTSQTFIQLTLDGTDGDRIRSVVDGVLNRHVELAADLKSGNLREQTERLSDQLAIAEAELSAATQALEQFRIETVQLPSEGLSLAPGLQQTQGPVYDEYFRMKLRQDELKREREKIENVLARSDSALPVEAIELIPAVNSSAELKLSIDALVAARLERQRLLERYTPAQDDVIAVDLRIRDFERRSIPSLLRVLVEELASEERQLQERIDQSGDELKAIPTRTIQEESLRNQVAIQNSLYTNLRERYQFSRLAQESSMPDVRILDPATVAEIPRGADRRAAIAIVLFLALTGAGMGGAILLDRMDPSVRTPEQLSTVLGLSILGVVPRIRSGVKDDSMDQAREAFRSLRTNVEFAYGTAGPMVIAISSPGQSEGKTLVTSNLGMCFAELGRRTLIIDGDTRRGDLHRALLGERKPGLTDYLRGKLAAEEVLQVASNANLHFIGSGTQVANSPELLSSSRMGELLGEMRKRYEVILVDCPPLGVGADALVLGSLAANLLLLFRSGSTHKDFAQARLEPLSRLPLRLLGAVLNDFQPDRLGNNYYTSYYGSYLPGYEAGAEDEAEDEVKALEGEPA